MGAEDDQAVEDVGSRRRKNTKTEPAGERECAGTSSTAEEDAGKLRGAGRAVKKEEATAEEATVKLGGAVLKKKKAARRPEARTEFLGVSRSPRGKYEARIIRRSKGVAEWLGSFDTAQEAAEAYDAAAVRLDGAGAVTNFRQAEARGVRMKVKKPAVARPDAWTEFRGVHMLLGGKYSARIWDPKGRSTLTLGSFGTGEEAARAYDAAAVKLRGAAARTNFEQQPTPAAAGDGEVSSVDLLNDFPDLPALDFSESLIPGPQMDDLRTEVLPAEWQLVHDFLKDFDEVIT